MNTITAILEPDADGTLHLPVPPEFKTSPRVKVVASFEDASRAAKRSSAEPSVQWPDFAAIRRRIFGPDSKKRKLSKEDVAFILDRGQW